MANMPMKIKHILQSIFNVLLKRNKNISYPRKKICNKCDKLLLFDNTKFCDICGCCISLKTTVKNEKCPLGKW